MFLRLLVAAGLGGAIGIEREIHGRSAGLRTQMLVAIGSALAMVVALRFVEAYGGQGGAVRVDPTRAAYGVLTGIGFLGAGAIIHYGGDIRGLTTAASLWCAAIIGLACGMGLFLLALMTTVLVLFALVGLDLIDHLMPHRQEKWLTVTMAGPACEAVERLRELLTRQGVQIRGLNVEHDASANTTTLAFHLRLRDAGQVEDLHRLPERLEGVHRVRVE